jgi:hypothetical protein
LSKAHLSFPDSIKLRETQGLFWKVAESRLRKILAG